MWQAILWIIAIAVAIPVVFFVGIFLVAAVRVAFGVDHLSKIERRQLRATGVGPDDPVAMGESVVAVLKSENKLRKQ